MGQAVFNSRTGFSFHVPYLAVMIVREFRVYHNAIDDHVCLHTIFVSNLTPYC